MAKKKAGGKTNNGRDSISKRLGVKIYGQQRVSTGNIIVRQRGTKYHPGNNVKRAADDSLYAISDGIVNFQKKMVTAFTGNLKTRTYVHVISKQD